MVRVDASNGAIGIVSAIQRLIAIGGPGWRAARAGRNGVAARWMATHWRLGHRLFFVAVSQSELISVLGAVRLDRWLAPRRCRGDARRGG